MENIKFNTSNENNVITLTSNNNNNNINNDNNNNNTNSIDWSNHKEVVLPNLIVVKILELYIEYSESIKYNELQLLSLVCKKWNSSIVPKLERFRISKCNDYVKTFSNMQNLVERLKRFGLKSGYSYGNNVYRSETKRIQNVLNMILQPKIIEDTINYFNEDILIDGIQCGTLFDPDTSKIKSFATTTIMKNGKSQPLEIDASRVQITQLQLSHHRYYYPKHKISLDKLFIYEEGKTYDVDHLNERKTTNEAPQYGVFLTGIPCNECEGCTLELIDPPSINYIYGDVNNRHETTSEYQLATNLVSRKFQTVLYCDSIEFLNNSVKRIKPISSGTCLVLKYNIFYDESEYDILRNSNNNNNNNNNSNNINTIINDVYGFNVPVMNQFFKEIQEPLKKFNVGITLGSVYSNTKIKYGHCEPLKGRDIILWHFFKEKFGLDKIRVSTLLYSTKDGFIEELNHRNVHDGNITMTESKHTVIFSSIDLEESNEFHVEDYSENRVLVFSAIIIFK
ncbi:hypothetical protein DICPUDRAFT_74907 [Dictyostelium purpureum]|uniref:Uncharacterized protein n=1 Tax=Dictyostelium purpureum TaxID=5786 RepID=F0Z933_DICPU|nr:uncharacterized protein DICPUDRAFT_74907 [Dictyostelium purpureum]EGC39561.1 hypothetical protein DICPUDRAFT_74907 [Dictyostelium purpureum]|eukprot:XP_003283896.1 hypothetical protein DICPUDRAFT_74907 [Dictyostelium purpureum]